MVASRESIKMCDDELVGRIMTVRRARELNARDFFYKILRDMPGIQDVAPGVENDRMKGGMDVHVHSYPDWVQRSQDMIGIAIDAAKAGMKGILFKDHFMLTAGEAYLVQKHIDHLFSEGAIPNRTEVYGGIGLNFGVRPDVVRQALKYPNMKKIYFPTFNSARCLMNMGHDASKGIHLVDSSQKVLEEVTEVLGLAADARVGVGLGHTDYYELLPVVEKAKEVGARVVLDHPLLELNKLTLDEMKTLAGKGAFVGTFCQPMIPSIYQPVADPFETVNTIREIGAERCLIASDFGQVLHVETVYGIRVFIRALLAFGISAQQIDTMFKANPAKLLWMN
jgi:Family of unknown function (DUF6282)